MTKDIGVLVNHQIRSALDDGRIVIDPFFDEQLNTVSYDVCLGEYVYMAAGPNDVGIIDLTDPADIRKMFPWEPIDLRRHESITLMPGARCLAHTDEYIGGVHHVTTKMHAKSSFGRVGMRACSCAGFGDVGYFTRWTAEIFNDNAFPIHLRHGTLFAQIVFDGVEQPTAGTEYGKTGNYQSGTDLEELKRNWRPEMMLPKPLKVAARFRK